MTGLEGTSRLHVLVVVSGSETTPVAHEQVALRSSPTSATWTDSGGCFTLGEGLEVQISPPSPSDRRGRHLTLKMQPSSASPRRYCLGSCSAVDGGRQSTRERGRSI
jgi:hypothetical protein